MSKNSQGGRGWKVAMKIACQEENRGLSVGEGWTQDRRGKWRLCKQQEGA